MKDALSDADVYGDGTICSMVHASPCYRFTLRRSFVPISFSLRGVVMYPPIDYGALVADAGARVPRAKRFTFLLYALPAAATVAVGSIVGWAGDTPPWFGLVIALLIAKPTISHQRIALFHGRRDAREESTLWNPRVSWGGAIVLVLSVGFPFMLLSMAAESAGESALLTLERQPDASIGAAIAPYIALQLAVIAYLIFGMFVATAYAAGHASDPISGFSQSAGLVASHFGLVLRFILQAIWWSFLTVITVGILGIWLSPRLAFLAANLYAAMAERAGRPLALPT
jgi:hypothetical protein